ncbi:hypothetical protein B4096_1949 [Heyndrickxia coagulans]|uniref:Uncharacterized protein n=1 Tax=Heyndrickxia coagulans TaxID=1398 RepID=A0A150KCU6_HEYCO|nr:hypothetical protein B4100_2040 [Heyndrickxia coagulans]KYC67393.1 hypothetical protein B4099_2010 [Heyndrickxia coagulans]KYC91148.1 hypothetical protein B4096_1949 [Heyndrickxia coagulans]
MIFSQSRRLHLKSQQECKKTGAPDYPAPQKEEAYGFRIV